MKKTLTPGKWRSLKTTSTSQNVFAILAFDQRGSYRRMLPDDTSYNTAVQIKQEIVTALAPHSSAVLLDAVYGLKPSLAMAGSSGLLMSLERTGYSGDATYRGLEFTEGWTVEKIKRMGASAVKMMVYYHPATGELAEELEGTVREVAQQCRRYDIPLFLEPMSYSLDASVSKSSEAFAATRPKVVRETARRLSALGPDVMKLEFPLDAAFNRDFDAWRAECKAISEVCEVPWVLLSAGVDFELFAQQARIACEAGASGFLAGRAIWKEAVAMSPAERDRFLQETAVSRLNALCEIANEAARPWTDFFDFAETGDKWFLSYEPIAR